LVFGFASLRFGVAECALGTVQTSRRPAWKRGGTLRSATSIGDYSTPGVVCLLSAFQQAALRRQLLAVETGVFQHGGDLGRIVAVIGGAVNINGKPDRGTTRSVARWKPATCGQCRRSPLGLHRPGKGLTQFRLGACAQF